MTKNMQKLSGLLVALLVAGVGADAYAQSAATIKRCEFPSVMPKPAKPDDPPAFPTLTCKVGTQAPGLKAQDFIFKTQEGDKPTQIQGTKVTPFKDSDEKLSIYILVQGSVRFMGDPSPEGDETQAIVGYFNEVKAAIDVIAKARTKNTEVGLYIYADKTITKAPMGPPEAVTGDSLGVQKDYSKLSTKALHIALQNAVTTLSQKEGRRVLILISDGGDQQDNYNPTDDIKKMDGSSIEGLHPWRQSQGHRSA